MAEPYKLTKGDVVSIDEDAFLDWYDRQPNPLRAMIQANVQALQAAGLPLPIAANITYNLLRHHEIVMLGRIAGPSMN